jgi:hypothetical protein
VNEYVYIWKKEGRCDASDYSFYKTVEGLWEVYDRMDGYKNLTKAEFIEAVEDSELVDEFGSEFYRDVLVS